MRATLLVAAALLSLAVLTALPAASADCNVQGPVIVCQQWAPLPRDMGWYQQTCVYTQLSPAGVCVLP
jgi:hypothetical protein